MSSSVSCTLLPKPGPHCSKITAFQTELVACVLLSQGVWNVHCHCNHHTTNTYALFANQRAQWHAGPLCAHQGCSALNIDVAIH